MKLTIEENREAIKRYGHIRPAPRWGSVQCSAKCPGSVRTCTLERGHTGVHVAHGRLRRVVAVWDEGISAVTSKQPAKRAGAAIARIRAREGGLASTLKALLRVPDIEAVALLILALFMVGFGIDWALRIFGVW